MLCPPETASCSGVRVLTTKDFDMEGADPSSKDDAGLSPAEIAAMRGDLQVLEAIAAQRGTEAEAGLLDWAAYAGSEEVLDFVLRECGATPEQARAAMGVAFQKGRLAIAARLEGMVV